MVWTTEIITCHFEESLTVLRTCTISLLKSSMWLTSFGGTKKICFIDVSVLCLQKISQRGTVENSETLWCVILEFPDLKVNFFRLGHNCFSLLIESYCNNYVAETRFRTGKNFDSGKLLHYGFTIWQMPLQTICLYYFQIQGSKGSSICIMVDRSSLPSSGQKIEYFH